MAAKALALVVTSAALAGAVRLFMMKPAHWPDNASPLFLVDNLSGFISLGISLFAFLVTIYSLSYVAKDIGKYFGYVLMTLGGSFGVALSNNFIALLVFWGLLAITLYLMVNLQGRNDSSEAAKKALVIVGGTDSLLLFGIGIIWAIGGTFSIDKINVEFNGPLPYIAFLSIVSAAFAKAGAMPFHSWLPDVAESAPTPVTAYLPASLDKLLGIYLLARVSLDMFVMNNISNLVLLIAGSVTIMFATVLALFQRDVKRMLGYCAVSQVGYIVIGIGTGNPIGIAGALFHTLNHAVYKSCLFLSAGNVEKRTSTMDMSKLGGLGKYMPVTFACFLTASLSISGIPPFNGFVSKWMVYQGIIETASAKDPLWIIWLVSAMFGSALTMAGFMKLLHAIFLGRPSKDLENVKEAPGAMILPVVFLAATCIVFGVFAFKLPLPMLILPSVKTPIAYIGTWGSIFATILIIVGVTAGAFIYLLFRRGGFRTVPTFIGGGDPDQLDRISGVEFYDTMKEIKAVDILYRKEEAKELDIYTIAQRSMTVCTRMLQGLHNGILPTYMVWCLLGMIAMFLILFLR
ncbi:MAG: proton-conducting transporter membrane subunit [Candidatus Omnitrophota bacterium]